MSEKLPPAPAPFETATPAFEQFMDKHFKSVLLVVGLVVLALCGYAFVKYRAKQKAEEAGAAFVAAKTVADYDAVVQNYPDSEAAGNAILMKADVLWTENKKDSSVAALREFLDKHADHPLYPQALLGLASKLEAMGERAEAKPLFERVATELQDSAIAPLAQIRLGDLLWAEGKEDEALKAYQSLPAKFPNADKDFIEESKEREKWVLSKLPVKEVDGPPKPKAPEPAPDAAPAAGPAMAPPKFNIPGLAPTVAPAGADTPMLDGKPSITPIPDDPPMITPTPAQPAPAPANSPATPAPAPAPTPSAPAVTPAPAPAPALAPAPATPSAAPAPAAPALAPAVAPAPSAAPTPPAPTPSTPPAAPAPAPAATSPAPAASTPPAAAAPAPVPTPAEAAPKAP